MKRRKVYYALDNVSVAIDVLQATTDYYKQMESVEAKDLIRLNDIVHIALRDSVNDTITALQEEEKDVDKDQKQTT